MPSANARGQGQRSERAAARALGGEVVGESREAVDVVAPNGTAYQVKSASHTKQNGRPGVFRFSADHLDALQRDHYQSGIALVLMPSVGASSSTPLKIETVGSERVREIVDGRWYPETNEYEVPWPKLMDH